MSIRRKGVDGRTYADRFGDRVGSRDPDKATARLLRPTRSDVALLAVGRDDVFHDDVSDRGVTSADRPSVVHAHGGRCVAGSASRALATQSWVNVSASVTFALYLTHATRPTAMGPGGSTEPISLLSAHGLDFYREKGYWCS
jgi:hypothetical protein